MPRLKIQPTHFIQTLVSCALALSLAHCPSSGGETDGDGDGPPYKFELSCSGGAIFRKIDTESGLPTEEGPVQLPAGMDCGDAADLPEASIRKLPREGDWTLYYKGTRTPIRKGRYMADNREGVWKGFDKNGQLDREISYQNGDKNGPETLYFAGTREWRERGSNSADKREGVWQTRHDKAGTCISEGAYTLDQKSGPWQECAQDPKTRKWYKNFEGGYLEGLRHGPALIYDADGQRIAEGNYYADTSDECKKNPPGGRGENCGKRDGLWSIYFSNGKLAMRGSYDRTTGNRTGDWVEYYQSGEKMAEGPREHTRRGHWTFYAKNGSKLFEGKFDGNDFSPRYAVLYENGRKESEGELSIGLVKYDVDNDTIKMSTLVKNGHWILYDSSNGRKIGEGEMIAGKKNGKWVEYTRAGQETVCYMLGRPRSCD